MRRGLRSGPVWGGAQAQGFFTSSPGTGCQPWSAPCFWAGLQPTAETTQPSPQGASEAGLQDPRAHTSEHLPRECPLSEQRWQELDTQGPELALQLANCPWDLWASRSLVWASVSSSIEWVTVIPVPNLHSS